MLEWRHMYGEGNSWLFMLYVKQFVGIFKLLDVSSIHSYKILSSYSCCNFFLQRLAAGEWFTARVSACGLFHIAYPSAPDTLKTELRSIYSQLCQDDMPMVRRSAATNLGKFAATVEPAHLKTDIMSIFEDLTQDGN